MHNAALVAQRHVAAHQHVIRDRLSKNLYAQHIGYYLLRLALNIRVHERHVVVGAYYVAERRESLFYALDLDAVWEGVAQVLEFLVGCGGGDEEAALVAMERVSLCEV